jgi:hypothetical protein
MGIMPFEEQKRPLAETVVSGFSASKQSSTLPELFAATLDAVAIWIKGLGSQR